MNDTISKSEVCEILADIYPTDGEKEICEAFVCEHFQEELQDE